MDRYDTSIPTYTIHTHLMCCLTTFYLYIGTLTFSPVPSYDTSFYQHLFASNFIDGPSLNGFKLMSVKEMKDMLNIKIIGHAATIYGALQGLKSSINTNEGT
jgi:hypothetical protein